MNIIYFGSSSFAVPALKALLKAGHRIPCVVTQPDRKKGRGLLPASTPVKETAQESGLTVYQPARLDSHEALDLFLGLKPDILAVAAYGQILPEQVLNIPRLIPLNIHASLLPKYRGASPINRAIINGETQSGVTIIKMTEEMDAGPIVMQKECEIPDEYTAPDLEQKLSQIGSSLILEAIKAIERDDYGLTPQDQNRVTFAPKLKKGEGLINWNEPAGRIHNLIRGCLPWPGAFTYYNGRLLKIYAAAVAESPSRQDAGSPGEVVSVSKEGIAVATACGSLIIRELQIEGKRRMAAQEFICGHRIAPGERFSGLK